MAGNPATPLFEELRERILPGRYREDLSDRVSDDSLLFKFGFCGPLIEDLERFCETIRASRNQDE